MSAFCVNNEGWVNINIRDIHGSLLTFFNRVQSPLLVFLTLRLALKMGK